MPRARSYEGSAKDIRQDRKGARRLGISQKAYERTPQDRAEDRAGQAAFKAKPRRK